MKPLRSGGNFRVAWVNCWAFGKNGINRGLIAPIDCATRVRPNGGLSMHSEGFGEETKKRQPDGCPLSWLSTGQARARFLST